MSSYQGQFIWYELMTTDTQAAEAFYRRVVGWQSQEAGSTLEGGAYTILSTPLGGVGGLMAMPDDLCAAGARPGWMGYIAVDDVDGMARRIEQAGGGIHHPPQDIPGVGRFAVVSDPQGAAFMLLKGFSDQPLPDPPPGTPGHTGWHELHTTDPGAALAFYAGLFGWKQSDAVDMGPMGIYQLFATAEAAVGGIMKKTPETPAPFWLYYINVDDIDAAVQRVKEETGQVLFGPQQVPGGSWIAQCLDPQGAMFALVGPDR